MLTPALDHPAAKSAPLTEANLDSVVRWTMRDHVAILEALQARLDQIEDVMSRELEARL